MKPDCDEAKLIHGEGVENLKPYRANQTPHCHLTSISQKTLSKLKLNIYFKKLKTTYRVCMVNNIIYKFHGVFIEKNMK